MQNIKQKLLKLLKEVFCFAKRNIRGSQQLKNKSQVRNDMKNINMNNFMNKMTKIKI
jgi:hypothetical protein